MFIRQFLADLCRTFRQCALLLLFYLILILPGTRVLANNALKSVGLYESPVSVREISGYVTGQGSVLNNALIAVKDTERQAFTDENGYYSIRAARGEIIVYSYMGLKSMEVIVEDVTKKLNVNLVSESRVLSEVKLMASLNSEESRDEIDSYFGKMDRKKIGYSSYYVAGEDLNLGAIDLVDALRAKVPGYQVMTDSRGISKVFLRDPRQAALWEVDGILFQGEPPYIDLTNIESVNVIKSPAGLARYGTLGRGGLIIVKTKDRVFAKPNSDNRISDSGTNKNLYKNDAVSINSQTYVKPTYWSSLHSANTHQEVISLFERFLPVYKDEASFYLNFAEKMIENGFKEKFIRNVVREMQDEMFSDPVALKSLAYFYQKSGWDEDAIRTYQRVLSLRPDYAQSYRDLANAYRSEGLIENSWNYYMNYLKKVNTLQENGIGEIIYHEMEEIYFRKPKGFRPAASFVSKTELKDVPKDLRLVFEWDNSEAEFELEFVNPEGQAYSFIHTFEFNSEQIIDEKTRGYSSKEFFIQNLDRRGWLINLTYYGNKSDQPTYFKVTHIENWAKKGQTNKIHVIKLFEKNRKFTLLAP